MRITPVADAEVLARATNSSRTSIMYMCFAESRRAKMLLDSRSYLTAVCAVNDFAFHLFHAFVVIDRHQTVVTRIHRERVN